LDPVPSRSLIETLRQYSPLEFLAPLAGAGWVGLG